MREHPTREGLDNAVTLVDRFNPADWEAMYG
jgi:hypothetical protein